MNCRSAACEEAIRATATKHAPWDVIPADHKWITRRAVAAAVVDTLARLELHHPVVEEMKRKLLQAARQEPIETDEKY